MKHLLKRSLALLLVLCLLPLAPAAARAAEEPFLQFTATVPEEAEAAVPPVLSGAGGVAAIGSAGYDSLEGALAAAQAGDTVVLTANASLSANAQVPAGVTLLVPCMAGDTGYQTISGAKANYSAATIAAGNGVGADAALYRRLSIPAGVTLTVNGTLLVNSVTGRPGGGNYDQDIVGGYGQIDLAGSITVAEGGTLDNFGYIRGAGAVTAEKGGTVGDLYVVRHWRGGNQAYEMARSRNAVYPFNEVDFRNIQTTLTVKAGANLLGLLKIYADGDYNFTRFPFIQGDQGLIRLSREGAALTRTVAGGRERYSFTGGASFAATGMKIAGATMSTADFFYPMDGDNDYVLSGGAYAFASSYKFLTGASLTVTGDAKLTVGHGKALVFYDKFDDLENVRDTQYPKRSAAVLTLAEGAQLVNKGSFAGTIVTAADNVKASGSPKWTVTTKESWGEVAKTKGAHADTVTLSFGLTINRTGHTWRLGSDGSILWDGAAETPAASFTDLETGAWYLSNVDYAVANGLMKGMGNGTFAPNQNMTRAQIAQMFFNLDDCAYPGAPAVFTDVTAADWFADPVNWAAQAGIVNGVGGGAFSPAGEVTREQIVTILFRYAGARGYNTSKRSSERGELKNFSDAAAVSDYATDAMGWAVAEGIINGMGDGTVNPQGKATRAQVAKIFQYFCTEIMGW